MKKFIAYFVRKIMKRPFEFDDAVPINYVIQITLGKIIALMRGIFILKQSVFLGRRSNINAKKNLAIGRSVTIGNNVVIDALSHEGVSLGSFSKIGSNSFILASGSLKNLGKGIHIGQNVGIGEFCFIGGAGGVVIGNDTIIGQYFSVHPENHNFRRIGCLIRNQEVTRKGVMIGNNCWIGAKVTICDGARIGDGCVVAAGSVVTKSFEKNSLIAGVPAKYIRSTYE